MRILSVTNLFPTPFEPNRATFNRQQLLALARRTPLHVIAPIAWTDELSARRNGASPLAKSRRVQLDGVTVDHPRYYFTPKLLRGWYGRFYKWSVRAAFKRAVDEFKPDIVYATWAYPDGWAAVRMARSAGLPVVIKVHGCDVLYGLRHNLSRLPGTMHALRAADAVVAVSKDLAAHVARFGVPEKRIRVVYNGVDSALFCPGSRDEARRRLGVPLDGRRLLFVGALLPVKGVDLLIEACHLLHQRGERFTCHVVGEGPLRQVLCDRIAALGLSDVVRLEGSLPHASLPDWFRAADLFVLPSRSEGVPCVLMEAIACGARFVAARVGGVGEVAHMGAGEAVPPENPAALADSIARGLESRDSREATSSGCKIAAIRGPDDAASDLLRLFDSVLSAAAPGLAVAAPTVA